MVALAIAPLPDALPVGAPLLAIASLSLWLRGRTWVALVAPHSRALVAGLLVGVVAIAIAGPLFRGFGVTALEWWLVPGARDGDARLFVALAIVIVDAVALELALRG
ncbi:MAG TPA: hypothetical protein VIV11_05735, partial [Kofleriaceae bacterium]